MANKMKI